MKKSDYNLAKYFIVLANIQLIHYLAFAQQLISLQPYQCSGTQFYDGRTFSCTNQVDNTIGSDKTTITCDPTKQYFKLGQICVQNTQVAGSTSVQGIYAVTNGNFAFENCLNNSNQYQTQYCFPQLNTCTASNTQKCIYLQSIFQKIPNKLINGFDLTSKYQVMSDVGQGQFGYIDTSFPFSAAAKSSVENQIINAYACYSQGNAQRMHPKSCNYLINRCLIRGFSSDYEDCALLQSISNSKFTAGQQQLYQYLTSSYTQQSINTNLYVMLYDQDGEFIDFRPFTTDLQLCSKGVNDDNAFKTFGSSFDNRCQLDPTTIKSTSNFFEIYTQDQSSSSQTTNKFQKLQVQVTYYDLWGKSDTINVNRFYLYEKGFYDQKIQVATSINLIIDVSNSQAYIKVNYQQLQATSTSTTTVNFSVSYQSTGSSLDNFWLVIKIFFAIYLVLVFLWCLARFYIWTMYNPRTDGQQRMMPNYTVKFLWNIFVIICDCYGEALIFFLFILSAALYIIAKASTSPNFIMPPRFSDSQIYTSFIICCAFGFAFKLIATFNLILKQSNCQIYFLDWEPKKKFLHQEEDKGQSSWRTLFVANEFNELAVYRIVSIEWTLFFMAMLMNGVDWENGASNTFSSSSNLPTQNIGINIIYKFFINASLFFFIGLIQIIARNLIKIWVPFKIQDFTDFCSVSNVSIFIFDDYLHGYYLHGQSPDKYAEGDSLWLMQCLGDDVPIEFFQTNNYNRFGRFPNQFNNSMMMRQLQQGTGGNMGYQSARGMQMMQQQPGAMGMGMGMGMGGLPGQPQQGNFPTQKMKREQRGLNNTNDQIFEFFMSWDLREQIDYMFEVRQKSIEYLEKKRKELELAKKAKQNLKQNKKNNELEIEEQKSLKNIEDVKEAENNQNYFADITIENGEELFKPKMDGILREVIRSMNKGAGQNSNIFEMEFSQRFLLHLPPPTHVDRRFNQNMFYVDRDNIFSSVLYSGYEFTLLYFYITVYTFIDLVSESTLVAVIVTYGLDYIFKYIRQERGQSNISTKAGIDEQFLI
ncbi:meckelin (macronuclear) [Tetrahymena thermophila SB210]|uniref:Meckelin n=1 Tax=Tetrahymena thermophila (strain SB210) TaxID=312017 RepID=Q22AI2_TETTS|nr:meckelin [Tetrahymena thermophila SB210]EAR82292.2 meckelin [Tetrahymena thermophila SB210]|eukprot:XP_001029955.2 meckelin [Tetrahymena thermophila SB210]